MEKLPKITTEDELITVIRANDGISNHDIEASEHTAVYGQLINSLVDKGLIDCFWSDLVTQDQEFYFFATQTWRLKE